MSLLAKLENSIRNEPDPAPAAVAAKGTAPEVSDADDTPTPADDDTPAAPPEADDDTPAAEPAADDEEAPAPEEDQEPAAPAAKAAALDPAKEYQIGEDTVNGEELGKGYLRQADYTRKTQALADKERTYTTRIEELEEQVADFSDWAKVIRDPAEMRHELETAMPETFAQLREMIIDEAIAEHDMTESERRTARENRKLRDAERLREKDAEAARKREARKVQQQKTTELRNTYNTWTKECMEEAGLDPRKAEHVDLLHAKVSTYKGTWGKDVFAESAKLVAKAIGVKKKEVKAEAKPASKPALPPVRSTGTTKTAAAEKPKGPKPVDDFFTRLRKNHGHV